MIEIVSVTVPDTAKDGKLLNGIIVGASKRERRWRLQGDPMLHGTRGEAEKAELRQELHTAIHAALDLDLVVGGLNKSEIVKLCIRKADILKQVLETPRFRSIIKKAKPAPASVQQEKITPERSWDHLKKDTKSSSNILSDLAASRKS